MWDAISKTLSVPVVVILVQCLIGQTSGEVGGSDNLPDFELIGFATVNGSTTGGTGGKTNTVTTSDEFRRAASAAEPLVILVSGKLDLGTETVTIGSNKTIIGLGTNAGFVGHIYLHGASNVIFRNLTFANPNGVGQGIGKGDGLTLHSSHHIWVDHCDFLDCADGQFDITHGSDFITISWCRFRYTNAANDHRLSMLIGNKDNLAAEDAGRLHVTLHHNWFGDLVQDRAPRVRFGQVHVFNNYYSATAINTCIGLGCSSQVLVESCYFEGAKRPWRSRSEPTCTQGRIQWNDDNVFTHPKLVIEETNTEVFKPPYKYKLDPGKAVKDIVVRYAGVGKGPFSPN